mmetsp:Transcript_16189/g.29160  ORF Transcript_16189/g.29160 Transcript_16189/m.29160 type:complete len:296 (-) Transcript_16189:433-1320(-)
MNPNTSYSPYFGAAAAAALAAAKAFAFSSRTNEVPFAVLDFNSVVMFSSAAVSEALRVPNGNALTTPFLESTSGLEKYAWPAAAKRAPSAHPAAVDTKAHSMTSVAPPMARRHESANRAAAKAMESVADPAPALASTTSVPASWIRRVRRWISDSDKDLPTSAGCGFICEMRGRMVMPAWPPTTGILTSLGSDNPRASARNVSARTTSRVVTPKTRPSLARPALRNTSTAMGTVEFTGLEMMATQAVGQCTAMASQRPWTIPALMLKRSSRVMPGLRGTPAGITTRSTPERAWGS